MRRAIQLQNKLLIMLLIAGALCSLPGTSVSAQDAGSINGIVQNENKEALTGVSVTLKSDSLHYTRSVVTDSSGRFDFPGLLNGLKYALSFSSVGYEPALVNDYTARAGTSPIVISLKSISKNLDDVVVVGYGTAKKSNSNRRC